MKFERRPLFLAVIACLALWPTADVSAAQVCPSGQKQVAYCFWRDWSDNEPCRSPMCALKRWMERAVCQKPDGELTHYWHQDDIAWFADRVFLTSNGGTLTFRTSIAYNADDPEHRYPSYDELRIVPIGDAKSVNSSAKIVYLGATFYPNPRAFHCDVNL